MSEVVFIGTSDAFGAGGRRQSAILVRGRRGAFLLDCGATTNTGLSELGIDRDEIDVVLISHFHGDHFGGIPLLLLAALYEDERTRPLQIAGPPGIEARVRELARAMGHTIADLDWTFPVTFIDLHAGEKRQIGPVEVEAFETRHQIEAHPHGHRVNSGSETLVYSGDTGWFDELPRRASGADLFICECTFHTRVFDYHLNLEQLVERRGDFDAGRIVLTHLGSEMADLRGSVPFETADDGMLIKL